MQGFPAHNTLVFSKKYCDSATIWLELRTGSSLMGIRVENKNISAQNKCNYKDCFITSKIAAIILLTLVSGCVSSDELKK
jgi:hypothetical protein